MRGSTQVEIAFQKSKNGPSIFDPVSQAERAKLTAMLEAAGVAFSYPDQGGMAFDSASDLLEIVVSSTVAFRAVRPVLLEWIKGRAGQKVIMKDGGKHIEAPTIEDAERAWKLIAKDEGDRP